jgi:uncharacterized protein
MKYIKLIVFTLFMFFVTWLLFIVASKPIFKLRIFENTIINDHLNYQLSGLVIASFTLIIIYFFSNKKRLGYLNLKRNGKMKPMFFLGIRHEGKWEDDGWSYGIIMIIIMVVLTGTVKTGFNFSVMNIIMAIPLAATNAFTEETIFRLSYVTIGDNETNSSLYGLIMGTSVFGIVHYWGIMPNGIFGIIISALLGCFLAKSIQETKGFYWAFMIHFLLDVVILLVIFNSNM